MDSSPNRPTNTQRQDRRPPVVSYLDGTCPSTTTMPRMDVALFKEAFICEICVEFYVTPYTLECGHTFCSACILNWFGRQKTCPHCRMDINIRPVPAFAVHNQVNAVRSMLFGHQVTNDTRAVRIAQQEFELMYPDARPLQFIQDQEDNVNRCGACAWELDEEGRCYQCDHLYRGAAYDEPFDSDDTMGRTSEEEDDLEGFVVNSDCTIEEEDEYPSALSDAEDQEEVEAAYLTARSEESSPDIGPRSYRRRPLSFNTAAEPHGVYNIISDSDDDDHSPLIGSNALAFQDGESDSDSSSERLVNHTIAVDSEDDSSDAATATSSSSSISISSSNSNNNNITLSTHDTDNEEAANGAISVSASSESSDGSDSDSSSSDSDNDRCGSPDFVSDSNDDRATVPSISSQTSSQSQQNMKDGFRSPSTDLGMYSESEQSMEDESRSPSTDLREYSESEQSMEGESRSSSIDDGSDTPDVILRRTRKRRSPKTESSVRRKHAKI